MKSDAITEFGRRQIVEELGGGGGGGSDAIWKPSVNAAGDISWTRSASTTAPTPQNIKGPQGETGPAGPQGPQGPQGEKGDPGTGGDVTWADIKDKPDNLATTEDVEAKVFIAEYNVTTAQEINAYLDAAKEPFAPVLIKRGNDYYTCTTAAKQADNKVIIRSFATLSGNFYMFTYTITDGTWASSSYGFQQLLVSGTNIKTINGQSILGAGDLDVGGGTGDAYTKAETNALLADKADGYYRETVEATVTLGEDAPAPSSGGITARGVTTGGVSVSYKFTDDDVTRIKNNTTATSGFVVTMVGAGDETTLEIFQPSAGVYRYDKVSGSDLQNNQFELADIDVKKIDARILPDDFGIPTIDEVLKKGNATTQGMTAGELTVYNPASGNRTTVDASSAYFQYLYEGKDNQRDGGISTDGIYFSHLEKSPAGYYEIVEDFAVNINGNVIMNGAVKQGFQNVLSIPAFTTLNDSASIETTTDGTLHRLGIGLESNTKKVRFNLWNGTYENIYHAETEASMKEPADAGLTPAFEIQNNATLMTDVEPQAQTLAYVMMEDNTAWVGERVTDVSPYVYNRIGTQSEMLTLTVEKDGDMWSVSASDGTMDPKNWRFFTSSPIIPRVQSWLEGVATVGDVDAGDAALQAQIDALGEPFRVKSWSATGLNVQIPYCTEDLENTAIPKMDFSIDDIEGAEYQIVGMIAYEVRGADGKRINCWPVCQFTGNGQKTLTVRWTCMGSARATATSINAWVLLKRRQ